MAANEQADSADAQKLELDIYGLIFRLRAPVEEHERLRRTAKYVDTVMREQASGQTSVDTTRLALQTAFLIAKNYFRAMDQAADQGTSGGTELTTRVDGLVQRLDQTLAALETEPDDEWIAGATADQQVSPATAVLPRTASHPDWSPAPDTEDDDPEAAPIAIRDDSELEPRSAK